jgi:hypothetical protein
MSSARELNRETLIEFLVERGFDRDVLTQFCSDSWLAEIAERQLYADPEDDAGFEEDARDLLDMRSKGDLRCEITDSVEEFLSNGGSIDWVEEVDVNEPGEAGESWAKERRAYE